MADSLIVPDPSEVKKTAKEILSKPELFNSELGYYELGEPYFLRRFNRAFRLTWSRIMWPIIIVAATACIGLYSGIAWDSVWRGIVAGLVTLFVGLLIILVFHYLFSAPKELDNELRGNLRAAKDQILEERLKAARATGLVLDNYTKCFQQLTDLKENEFADITIKIEEIYLKSNYEGLHITMRVVLTNQRADATIQGFTVKFIDGSGEYDGEDIDVSDYSIVREEPTAYLHRKREIWESLSDLRRLNTTPFKRKTHREGWLRFRLSKLRYICTPRHGLVKLEILDSSDRLYEVQISDPWPKQTGWISLNSRFDEPLSGLTIARAKKAPKQL